MKLYFNINFHTRNGEKLQVLINEDGQDPRTHTLASDQYGNWKAEVDFFSKQLSYHYQVASSSGEVLDEEFAEHHLELPHNYQEFQIFDVWNLRNFPENYLNNKILQNRLSNFKAEKITVLKKHTHLFRLEAPVYNAAWRIVLIGNTPSLGKWEYLRTVPMKQTDFGIWEAAVEIAENQYIEYKYGLMDDQSGEVFDLEYGENRHATPNTEKNILQIQADHFFRFKAFELYHAAGVAVPVFSLRSENSFGVGEFADLKILADWTSKTKLGIIQILPINDTTAD